MLLTAAAIGQPVSGAPLVAPCPVSLAPFLQGESRSSVFRRDFSPVSLFSEDVWKTEDPARSEREDRTARALRGATA